jgi:hypothetical protein
MAAQMISDETLMAFVDGELAPNEKDRVAAAIAADPALAERVRMFERTRKLAHDAFAPLLDEPVPDALRRRIEAAAATQAAANVVALPRRGGQPLPAWLPLAASIAAVAIGIGGFLAGRTLGPSTQTPRIALGEVPAELAAALASKPSGTREDHGLGKLSLIASFKTGDGRLCREFELDPPRADTLVAVACRGATPGWQVVFAVAAPPGADSYAPASSLQVLENYLAATGAGSALSAEEERAALSQ